MEFCFETIEYDRTLPTLPKHSGVYKIFDIRGKLIVLDKTSDLFERFARYYGESSGRVCITSAVTIRTRIACTSKCTPARAPAITTSTAAPIWKMSIRRLPSLKGGTRTSSGRWLRR